MIIVEIAGFLGADPEERFTANGKRVVSLRVATRVRKGGQDETVWWRVNIWDDRFDKMIPHLKKCSAVIIPYDPRHYKIRLSGVAIECGALGIPVITTGHTWVGNMVKMGKMAGTTFSFANYQELFEKRLARAINKIFKNKNAYQKMAKKHDKFFLNNFSAKNYLKKLSYGATNYNSHTDSQ